VVNEVLEDIGSMAPGDFIQEVVGREGDDPDRGVGRVHVLVGNSEGGVMGRLNGVRGYPFCWVQKWFVSNYSIAFFNDYIPGVCRNSVVVKIPGFSTFLRRPGCVPSINSTLIFLRTGKETIVQAVVHTLSEHLDKLPVSRSGAQDERVVDERVANGDGAVSEVADGINVEIYSPPGSAVLEEVAIQFLLCLPGLAGGDEDGVLEPEDVFCLQWFWVD
jgi:hypothetical protein